jgi:hypothetical protein
MWLNPPVLAIILQASIFWVGETFYAEGQFGQAFNFDGTQDAVYLGDDVAVKTGFSFSARDQEKTHRSMA